MSTIIRYRCRLCGRNKFYRPGQGHKCVGGYRKRFKKAARLRGWDNCFEAVPHHDSCITEGPMFERSQPEKTKTVTLRITDEERLAIMLKCEEKGVSISDLLREAMRRFLTQDNLPID